MDNINVTVMDMPLIIRGMTKLNEDNFYNIFINAKYSYEEQKKILKHELKHIEKDHFFSDKSIQECENEANE